MRLNGHLATEVAQEAFLPALKYGEESPTRCDHKGGGQSMRVKGYVSHLMWWSATCLWVVFSGGLGAPVAPGSGCGFRGAGESMVFGQVMAERHSGLGLPLVTVISPPAGPMVAAGQRRGQRRSARPPSALSPAGPQMVFIRLDDLGNLLDEYRLRSEQVKRDILPRARELQERLNRLLADLDGLKDIRDELGEEEYQARRKLLLAQKQSFEADIEQLNARLVEQSELVLQPVRKRIQESLCRYARERGIELVVDRAAAFDLAGLIYLSPALDITEDFAGYYNRLYPVRGVTRQPSS